MSLGPLRPSPLVEQAAERIRAHIAEGYWPVGGRLPGETTLATTLGVGRSTVREALRALAGAGLVQARQGAGVFVTATTPREDWPTRLRKAQLADLYEVRMLVEVQAAGLAAARRTEADITALRAALDRRRAAAAEDDVVFVDADIALHAAVAAAAHNPVLTDLLAEFAPVLREGLVELIALLDLRAEDAAHGEERHAELVEAVRRGDARAAERASHEELSQMLAHLRAG
ncbi:FadR/GntR family transcriptional regulator [Streptomyces sp. PU-14G]|uniref:FadR/GntR family transcriptional regulator n=1 Tax=Streptomyces sp. PU-14G TaxID=2800808 RepID=UPI0034E01F7C